MTGQSSRNSTRSEPSRFAGEMPPPPPPPSLPPPPHPQPVQIPLVGAKFRVGNEIVGGVQLDPRKADVLENLASLQRHLNNIVKGGVTLRTMGTRQNPNVHVAEIVFNESGVVSSFPFNKHAPNTVVTKKAFDIAEAIMNDPNNNISLLPRAQNVDKAGNLAPIDLEGIGQSNEYPSLGKRVDDRSAARPVGPPATRGGMRIAAGRGGFPVANTMGRGGMPVANNIGRGGMPVFHAAGRGRGGAGGPGMGNRGNSNVVRRHGGAGNDVVRRGPTGDQQM